MRYQLTLGLVSRMKAGFYSYEFLDWVSQWLVALTKSHSASVAFVQNTLHLLSLMQGGTHTQIREEVIFTKGRVIVKAV